MKKHIEKFNTFSLDEGLFSKRNKKQRLIDDILSVQGKNTDQRLPDQRTIYTEDELLSMEPNELSSIWRSTQHPRGRNW